MMEKLRISAWKKNPVSAEKDKESKDSPRMFENSVSAVTKGVKFAVSMYYIFYLLYSPSLSHNCSQLYDNKNKYALS